VPHTKKKRRQRRRRQGHKSRITTQSSEASERAPNEHQAEGVWHKTVEGVPAVEEKGVGAGAEACLGIGGHCITSQRQRKRHVITFY